MLLYRPQLATLITVPPSGPEWLHELKLDGYRIGAVREPHRAPRLESRREIDWTSRFPEVAAAVRKLPVESIVLDGEVAIVTADGRTSFQALQNVFEARGSRGGLVYFVFDLLYLDGNDLTPLPLEERKGLLERLLPNGDAVLRYSQHFDGDGPTILSRACELGAEGIVSKRRKDRYRAGRGNSWVKAKCVKRALFVIGGFTEPEGSRVGIGGLLLGYFDDAGELHYAGKVGTGPGFTADYLREVRRGLQTIEQPECPYSKRPPADMIKGAHWLRPLLVGELSYIEWTDDGHVRHPSFQGFKPDAVAADVRRPGPCGHSDEP